MELKKQDVDVFRFNASEGAWKKWSPGADDHLNVNADKLSFITFNIWKGTHMQKERTMGLLTLLSQYNADVICLQEVKPSVLHTILKQDWVRKDYFVSEG